MIIKTLELLDELDELLKDLSRVPLVDKVLMDPEIIQAKLDNIRSSLPPDLEEAKEIREKGDKILSDARAAAERIRDTAEKESRTRIEQNAIVQEANARSKEINQQAELKAKAIIEDAEKAAHQRREEADKYSLNTLEELQQKIDHLRGQVVRGIEVLHAMDQSKTQKPSK